MSNGHLSFDDLGEVRIDALLVRPDGRQLHVPMRSLSDKEVWELRGALKWPAQPTEIARWDGPDKPPRPGPITSGPAFEKWQQAMSETNRLWYRTMLVRALCIDIPGDTTEAKAAAIETKVGAWASRQLNDHLNRMLGIGDAEVSARADSFQPARDNGASDTEGTGLDAAEMAQVVPHG